MPREGFDVRFGLRPVPVAPRLLWGTVGMSCVCFLSALTHQAGGHLTSSYAIKTLSICTKSSRRAQEEVLRWDKSE